MTRHDAQAKVSTIFEESNGSNSPLQKEKLNPHNENIEGARDYA
jgi:hypothetical protein